MNLWLLQLIPQIAVGVLMWNWLMGPMSYPSWYQPLALPDTIDDAPLTSDSDHRGLI